MMGCPMTVTFPSYAWWLIVTAALPTSITRVVIPYTSFCSYISLRVSARGAMHDISLWLNQIVCRMIILCLDHFYVANIEISGWSTSGVGGNVRKCYTAPRRLAKSFATAKHMESGHFVLKFKCEASLMEVMATLLGLGKIQNTKLLAKESFGLLRMEAA